MSKKSELLKNTLIIGVGRIATQFISFILLPLYTIYLAPSEYGLVDLALTYVMLAVPVITIQLELGAFRYLIEARGNHDRTRNIISSTLNLYFILTIIATLGAFVINYFASIPHFWYIYGVIIATTYSSLLLHIARGIGKNKFFAMASIATGLTTLAAVLVFVVSLDWGARGVFSASIIANISCTLFLLLVLRLNVFNIANNSDSRIQRELSRYSIPLVPNSIALWVINVSDRTIITIMMGVAANGIYAVSGRIALALAAAFAIFLLSWTESVSAHLSAKDQDNFISDSFNAGMSAVASLGLIAIASMPFVFQYLIGQDFQEGIAYAPALIIGVVFSAAMSLYGAVYIAVKKTKSVAITSIIAAVVNIILTVLFIPFWGLQGAAVASALTFLLIAAIRHIDTRKYVTISLSYYKMAVLAGAYVVVILIMFSNSLILQSISVVTTFALAILFNKREVQVLGQKIRSRYINQESQHGIS